MTFTVTHCLHIDTIAAIMTGIICRNISTLCMAQETKDPHICFPIWGESFYRGLRTLVLMSHPIFDRCHPIFDQNGVKKEQIWGHSPHFGQIWGDYFPSDA
jgi:hypothetical protein